ncbi:hypothetical protein SynBIOSE41_03994 [Synechococcus sp. BIOS-E4-1]|nr:hypothetical protein SynBIOSE41_03994 [Synechococcus sp. BIOS-E4-1]
MFERSPQWGSAFLCAASELKWIRSGQLMQSEDADHGRSSSLKTGPFQQTDPKETR